MWQYQRKVFHNGSMILLSLARRLHGNSHSHTRDAKQENLFLILLMYSVARLLHPVPHSLVEVNVSSLRTLTSLITLSESTWFLATMYRTNSNRLIFHYEFYDIFRPSDEICHVLGEVLRKNARCTKRHISTWRVKGFVSVLYYTGQVRSCQLTQLYTHDYCTAVAMVTLTNSRHAIGDGCYYYSLTLYS